MNDGQGSPSAGTVVRGMSWVAVGHAVSQACWFGSLLIAAAVVSPEAFGGIAIAMVAVQVAWLVVGSGTRGAFVVAERLDAGIVRRALAVNLATGAAIAVAAAAAPDAALGALAPGADPAMVRALAASVLLFAGSIVPLAVLQKEMRFRAHAAANAGAALLGSAISLAALALGAGAWSLVLRQVAFQALLAGLAWVFARRLVPLRGARGVRARRPRAAWGFFALAVIAFGALNVDNVVVAHLAGPRRLGLYALAFTIAFTPMTQVAWQLGKVLFPATARTDAAAVPARASKAIRLAALVLLPATPIAIALVPVAVPGLLGPRWAGMVVPLQILLAAGCVHALLAILREFLLGCGTIAVCVRIEAVWLVATAALLVPAVAVWGIVGAALVHVVLALPLAAAYARLGIPRIGLRPRTLLTGLRAVALPAAAEAVAVAAVVPLARAVGAGSQAAWELAALAAVVALAVALPTLGRPVLREGRAVLGAVRPAGGLA